MSFLTSLPVTPPVKSTSLSSSQISRSISLASTVILSSSESSEPEDTAWVSTLQELRKSALYLGALNETSPATPASNDDDCRPSPSPLPTKVVSPAPLIPFFPGITTPTSAPLYVSRIRSRTNKDDTATFFDVFAPEVDTPSPIRLTRQLSFLSLPSLPVTSMSTTWQLPQVVLEEDESERQTPQLRHSFRLSDAGIHSSAGCSSVSALGRPLGSPISLWRARNGSEVSFDGSVSALALPDSNRLSTVSCHTFGHSIEHSASMKVLYGKSPSPAVSVVATPSAEAPDFSAGHPELVTSSLLQPVISPGMRRPLDDSPAVGGEKPRRRRGSGPRKAANGAPRSIFVYQTTAPPVLALPRPYPSLEDIKRARRNSAAKVTISPAPSSATSRSAYADVSDYDALSPGSQRSLISPGSRQALGPGAFSRSGTYSGSPDTVIESNGNRRKYSNDPLQVVTTAFASPSHGSPILSMSVTRTKVQTERFHKSKAHSCKAKVALPRRNASMLDIRTSAEAQTRLTPMIPLRSSSTNLIAPPSPAGPSHVPITAASSMPIPQISVSAYSPQPDSFSPVLPHQQAVEVAPGIVGAARQDTRGIVPKAAKLLKGAKLSRWKQKGLPETPNIGPRLSSPPESVNLAQCSPLRRSASALSMLMKLDKNSSAPTAAKDGGSRAGQVSAKDEAVIPIAIISRENSLVLDREEAERFEKVGTASLTAGGRSARGTSDEEDVELLEDGMACLPRKMVSMQDALAMGPDLNLVLVHDEREFEKKKHQQQTSAVGVEGKKGWIGVPAALRSVRSFASLANPRSPRKPSLGINVPLPTPPDERDADKPRSAGRSKTPSNAPAKVSYDVMLGVAGALLAMDGNRQRSHSLTPNDSSAGPEIVLEPSTSSGSRASSRMQRSERYPTSNLERPHPQAPATPPQEEKEAVHERTLLERTPAKASALQLGLGPAFTTPSPAAAVRDIAWAGRPELITDSGSEISTIELRRAFWNDDGERVEDDRFRRCLPPASPSSDGLTPRSGGESVVTPLRRSSDIGLGTSTTMSSIRRYERDQYTWLRMQEASPTLPACDLPRSSSLGSAISTIPFPRASPGYEAPPARPRRSPLRAKSTKRSIGVASGALIASLQLDQRESGSGGSGMSDSDEDGRDDEEDSTSDSSDPCKTPSPRSERRMAPLPMTPSSCKGAFSEAADLLPLEAWLQWTD
ncbi:hypothetical protein CF319_g5820 [Tilletia indica]|nr:hypothetical protein CF319_g5820 [Tilletia indica]